MIFVGYFGILFAVIVFLFIKCFIVSLFCLLLLFIIFFVLAVLVDLVDLSVLSV